MPRTKATAAREADKEHVTENPNQAEESMESKERVDLDGDDDLEETIEEEEVEYEEIEEVEEVEEVEEEEEEEEEVEEEVEEEEENEGTTNANIKVAEGVPEDEKKKHAELLALPPHGSEVYLGGIPRDATEDDLRVFCESIGQVTEVRIMKGKVSGEAKGYAFVTFRNKEFASKAIEKLNDSELKGRKIKCSTSQAKHRLFIGNVPRNWEEEGMKKVLMDVGPGVVSVELLKAPHVQNANRNRGYAFVEYYNSACAEYARQKMSDPKFRLDSNAPTVSWADPRNTESSSTSQVKAVYVKNLPKDITQDCLRRLFEHHGKITKVVVPPAKPGHENSRFGFVHFAERSSVMKALKNTEKYEIDGQVLDCSLAKPQADQKFFGAENLYSSALLPTYPPPLGLSMIGGAYGAVGAGFRGAGFGQPLIYGRGPTPAGMAMMPMLLPDGRVGYVLQQPTLQPHIPPPQSRGGRSGPGGSSSGGRSGNDSNRGRSRYNPY